MNNLKNLRINRNYTAAQLADILGVGESVVCRWETGDKKPGLFHFLMLCKTLTCQPQDLFSAGKSEDGNCKNLIPVLGKNNIIFTKIPENTSDFTIDFAIILDEDISGRFKKGDICFFSFKRNDIHNGNLVINLYKNHCNLAIFDNNITNGNIIAACTFLKQRL